MSYPKVRRLTVEVKEPLPPLEPDEFFCAHEVAWYSTTDYVEHCAICGKVLGEVKWKPK